MLIAVNAATFPPTLSAAEQLAQAAAAGFEGFEPVVAEGGPLPLDTAAAAIRDLARAAADRNMTLVGLSCPAFMQLNFASPNAVDRELARTRTLHLLDLAAAGGIGAILIIPAVVGRATETQPRTSYAEALRWTIDALLSLRHEAEARAVCIAIENVWNRFLLSPLEMADVIDRAGSSCVGVYFDTGNVLAWGYPQDWIRTLGRRIVRVHAKDYDLTRPGSAGFCMPGDGSVDWSAVRAALAEIHYDGPLTYEGNGDPAVAARRLRNLRDGQPIRGAEGGA